MQSSRVSWGCLVAAFTAVVALAAGPAHAEDRNDDWSFGAGVGTLFPTYRTIQANNSVILLPTSGSGPSTPVVMSFERRLVGNLWLGLHGDVVVTSSNPDSGTNSEKGTVTAITGGLGLRYVVNPGALVEFSPLVAAGITSVTTDVSTTTAMGGAGDKVTSHTTGSELGPTGGVGFTAEAFLGRGVSLRLSTLVASVAFVKSSSKTTALGVTTDKSGGTVTTFSATLSPTLELRVSL